MWSPQSGWRITGVLLSRAPAPLPWMHPHPLMNTLFSGCPGLPESCEPKQVFAGKLCYRGSCPSLVGPMWMVMGLPGELEALEGGGLQLSAGFPMGRRMLWSLGLLAKGFPSGAWWLVQPSLPAGHVPEPLGSGG